MRTDAEKKKLSCFQPAILSHSLLISYNTLKQESTLPEEAVTADSAVGENPADEGELQPGAGE